MKSTNGHFLVASPHLSDGNFYHSVVLMIQHDDEGAFGVVLNRPSKKTISDLWDLVDEAPVECTQAINIGGPVPGPLIALHTREEHGETEILPGVFFSSSKEAILPLMAASQSPLRLFVGYSGWGGGQLDGELEAGGWLTTPASREDVFANPGELWSIVSQRIGMDIMSPAMRDIERPDDPSLN